MKHVLCDWLLKCWWTNEKMYRSHYLRCRKVVLLSRAGHLGLGLFCTHWFVFWHISLALLADWFAWLHSHAEVKLFYNLHSQIHSSYGQRGRPAQIDTTECGWDIGSTAIVSPICPLFSGIVIWFWKLSIKLKDREKKQKIKKSFTDSYRCSKGFCMEVN